MQLVCESFFGVFLSEKDPVSLKELVKNKYQSYWNIVLCLILSTAFFKEQTASDAFARLTGAFLFKGSVRAPTRSAFAGKALIFFNKKKKPVKYAAAFDVVSTLENTVL